jgi:hypothetical protein
MINYQPKITKHKNQNTNKSQFINSNDPNILHHPFSIIQNIKLQTYLIGLIFFPYLEIGIYLLFPSYQSSLVSELSEAVSDT